MTSILSGTAGSPRAPQILVIDDGSAVVRQLAVLVGPLAKVTLVAGPAEALEVLHRDAPDVVLVAASAAAPGGLEICTTIRKTPAWAELAVLAVSPETDAACQVRALEAGASDVITDPLCAAVALARVRTHLVLKQRTDQVLSLSVLDAVTGIANRRAFDAALEQECRRACRSGTILSLLTVDIDDFKPFNEHYGHVAGDQCLRQVATVLAASVRRPGEIVARYAGEEFSIILPVCGKDDAMGLGEKARAAVEALQIPHKWSKAGPVVTVSVGVASVDFTLEPKGSGGSQETGPLLVADALRESVLALLQTADGALYEAKRGGRNRVAWSPAPAS
jgi:diguanylate cyclase (GGDEF)-like protein